MRTSSFSIAVVAASIFVGSSTAAAQEPTTTIVGTQITGSCNQVVDGHHNRSTLICNIESMPKWPFFLVGGASIAAGGVVLGIAEHQQNEQLALDPFARDPSVRDSLRREDIAASILFAGGGAALFFGLALWLTPSLADALGPPPTTGIAPWVDREGAGITTRGQF
ncbi:MAG TPA: hypothetical protein VK841_07225 [Polyangiaceae bacterium]|jgi:hypothetical protein|nr:hypothetical protein [Polyangiaceae bacterium]